MTTSTYYTLDRGSFFSSGQSIELLDPFCPIETLKVHASEMFSPGVSKHANNYFFNYSINLVQSEERFGAIIEMLLEERRRSKYPDKPSRHQSLFACETIKEVAWFRGSSRFPISTPIFEVYTASTCHKGDMNLLKMNCSPVELSQRIDLYWRGETQELWPQYAPFWEVLIPLPAVIGEKVQE